MHNSSEIGVRFDEINEMADSEQLRFEKPFLVEKEIL